ncbi:hypothetical protein AWB65_03167 [Caballeronia humi]|jgi:hypothetical protein|uniref:Uncharacterized protein n=1 Tax=Caballeronia humi TaxID=326474 RepID=A0A158HCN4_9BURK|nr:hypothetical protein AWB65_03167 [Caballeronia humi]
MIAHWPYRAVSFLAAGVKSRLRFEEPTGHKRGRTGASGVPVRGQEQTLRDGRSDVKLSGWAKRQTGNSKTSREFFIGERF